MDRIKRFFECLIPVTSCNLKCGYCYVIQRDNRTMQLPKMKYPPHIIGEGLTQDRLGGICYFSICGAGETLIPLETILITKELLKNGHYVNLTTNGTITKRIDELLQIPHEDLTRLNFSFSLHYNELIRLGLMDSFFENIEKVKTAGCSFVLQINLCDEYLSAWDEIKRICIERVGAPPQVAATRKENDLTSDIILHTSLSFDDYLSKGKEFESPLFDFTMKNFNYKRNEFCYAGDWSGTLDLGTGILSRCYGTKGQDIFADINKPIHFCAVGKCPSLFCMNSSHFMSLGVIPDVETPTYGELRNRKSVSWYNPKFELLLNQKLGDNNKTYSYPKKKIIYVCGLLMCYARKCKKIVKKAIKNETSEFKI